MGWRGSSALVFVGATEVATLFLRRSTVIPEAASGEAAYDVASGLSRLPSLLPTRLRVAFSLWDSSSRKLHFLPVLPGTILMPRQVLHTDAAPAAIGPYSQAVR